MGLDAASGVPSSRTAAVSVLEPPPNTAIHPSSATTPTKRIGTTRDSGAGSTPRLPRPSSPPSMKSTSGRSPSTKPILAHATFRRRSRCPHPGVRGRSGEGCGRDARLSPRPAIADAVGHAIAALARRLSACVALQSRSKLPSTNPAPRNTGSRRRAPIHPLTPTTQRPTRPRPRARRRSRRRAPQADVPTAFEPQSTVA